MDQRFRSYNFPVRPWGDYTWSNTWEQRENRIIRALQFNKDPSTLVPKQPSLSPPKVCGRLVHLPFIRRSANPLTPRAPKAMFKASFIHLHVITGFTVLLTAVPAMLGWAHSEPGPGWTEDADFWWLLAGIAFQI
ncbi:hypothetical protein PG994_003188 [Apiospora phragmitis]|uniref:Uncharacterized protein n=1 Tax=Apiospora phragmitis TaxID=2905665 RepID=A0ABR1VXC7_9PEZI